MKYQYLDLEVSDGLGVVTMNRPPGNALSLDFVEELGSMVDEVSTRQEVRCVLFESALEKAFMFGADLKELPSDVDMSDIDPSWPPKQIMAYVLSKIKGHIADMLEKAQGVMNNLERVPKPTIAAINGHALGGGLEFSLACDIRIMARGRPKIGLTETGLGLIPAAGGCQRLPLVVGRSIALEMVYLAKRLDADQAREIGLIHEAVDPEQLKPRTLELGATLARGATVAYAAAKNAILTGEQEGLEAGLEAERDGIGRLAETADLAEGLMAFNAKTEPNFEGK